MVKEKVACVKEREKEILTLKESMRYTNLMEYEIQSKTYFQEIIRLKRQLEHSNIDSPLSPEDSPTISMTEQAISEVKKQIKEMGEENEQLHGALSSHKATIERLKDQVDALHREIDRNGESAYVSYAEKNVLQDHIKALQDQIQFRSEDIGKVQDQLDDKDSCIKSLEQQLRHLNVQQNEFKAQISTSKEETERQVAGVERDRLELEKRCFILEERSTYTQSMVEKFKTDKYELEKQFQKSLEETSNTTRGFQETINELRQEISKLNMGLSSSQTDHIKQIAELKTQLLTTESAATRMKMEKETLIVQLKQSDIQLGMKSKALEELTTDVANKANQQYVLELQQRSKELEMTDQIRSLQDSKRQTQRELKLIEEKMTGFRELDGKNTQFYQNQIQEKTSLIAQLQERDRQLTEIIDKLQQDCDSLRASVSKSVGRPAEARIMELSRQIESCQRQLEEKASIEQALMGQAQQYQEALEMYKAETDKLQTTVETLHRQNEEMKWSLEQSASNGNNVDVQNLNSDRDKLRARIARMEDLVDNLRQENESLRSGDLGLNIDEVPVETANHKEFIYTHGRTGSETASRQKDEIASQLNVRRNLSHSHQSLLASRMSQSKERRSLLPAQIQGQMQGQDSFHRRAPSAANLVDKERQRIAQIERKRAASQNSMKSDASSVSDPFSEVGDTEISVHTHSITSMTKSIVAASPVLRTPEFTGEQHSGSGDRGRLRRRPSVSEIDEQSF